MRETRHGQAAFAGERGLPAAGGQWCGVQPQPRMRLARACRGWPLRPRLRYDIFLKRGEGHGREAEGALLEFWWPLAFRWPMAALLECCACWAAPLPLAMVPARRIR